MSLRAQKNSLTREIKAQQEVVKEYKELSERQGEQYYFEFEGRRCPRWMRLGEWFFPSTIRREEKYLNSLIARRKKLDEI